MVELPDVAKISKSADFTGALRRKDWCCQTGLNCRPLHYQWSALPLSYGSVPRIRESAKRPLQGAPILATRPEAAQARGTACEVIEAAIISTGAPGRLQLAQLRPIRFPFPRPEPWSGGP